MKSRTPLWLALDSQKSVDRALALVDMVMRGPVGKYIEGIKMNDFLDHFGSDGFKALTALYPELSYFIDRKFHDVASTVQNIMEAYEMLPLDQIYFTVMAQSSFGVFEMIAREFPAAHPIIMCLPTDISPEQCKRRWHRSPYFQMDKILDELISPWREDDDPLHTDKPAHYAIASYDTIPVALAHDLLPITPGIRDEWMLKKGTDGKGCQERVTGVIEALEIGAQYVVLGNQLFRGNPDAGIDALESQRLTAALLDNYFSMAEQLATGHA